MSTSFRSLPADRALREAICILLDMRTETKGTPNLVVTETDGSFAGLLTPRSLLQALLKSWQPDESLRRDEAWLAHSLLQLVRGRLDTAIGELMIRDLPRAQPGDRLLRLVELISDRRLECVPVFLRLYEAHGLSRDRRPYELADRWLGVTMAGAASDLYRQHLLERMKWSRNAVPDWFDL